MDINEASRKLNNYIITSIIIVVLLIGLVFLFIYLNKSTPFYVDCVEKKNINYSVLLSQNEYFENNLLGENKQYISSLIEKVNANIEYKMSLGANLPLDYKYKIVADLEVIEEETNKPLYRERVDLIEEVEGSSNTFIDIEENIVIDYPKYNDLVNKFINVYNLKNTISAVTVNLYVNVAGKEIAISDYSEPEASLSIPLAVNTIEITETAKTNEREIDIKVEKGNALIWLKLAFLIWSTDIGLLFAYLYYCRTTSSDTEKYERKLKNILNSYGSYISILDGDFDMSGYRILKVRSFADLLEVRDTIHVPITMVENKEQMVTYFAIPSNQILYFYSFGVEQKMLPVNVSSPSSNDVNSNLRDENDSNVEE